MFKEFVGKTLWCDVCGKQYNGYDGDNVAYEGDEDGQLIADRAQESGWTNVDGQDMCEGCYTKWQNKEEEETT